MFGIRLLGLWHMFQHRSDTSFSRDARELEPFTCRWVCVCRRGKIKENGGLLVCVNAWNEWLVRAAYSRQLLLQGALRDEGTKNVPLH